MRWGLLALLVACDPNAEGGGTAVGNPGKTFLRLAPDGLVPWTLAEAREVELRFSNAEDSSTVTVGRPDLISGPEVEVPPGAWTRLELTVTDLNATGEEPLMLPSAMASLSLDAVSFGQGSWIVELGEPGFPEAIADRSGIFVDRNRDGIVDAVERAVGPESQGPERLDQGQDIPVVVGVGASGVHTTFVPSEGAAHQGTAEGPDLERVVHRGGRWVAVGEGRVGVSDDFGTTWTFSDAPESFSGLAADEALFYAAGSAGGIYSSPDGESWTLLASSALAWTDIAVGPQGLTAVGPGQAYFRAPGASGEVVPLEGEADLRDLATASWGFVAVGDAGTRWFAFEGNWREKDSGGPDLHRVVWSGSRFIASAEDGSTLVSNDAEVWVAGPAQPLSDLVRHENAVFGVAPDGSLLRSDDHGDSWTAWSEAGPVLHALGSNRP